MAVYLIGASFYFGLLLAELDGAIRMPVREIVVIALGVLIFWVLRSLYRGRHWARVFLLVLFGLSFLGLDAVLRKEGFDFWRSMAQMAIQVLVIVLLFLRQSRDWFKRVA
jgi:hypothetical protein